MQQNKYFSKDSKLIHSKFYTNCLKPPGLYLKCMENALLVICSTVHQNMVKNSGQKVASVRWWDNLPTFVSRFHGETNFNSWNMVKPRPNVGRMFHHLMEASFWPCCLPCFGETLNKISYSVSQKNEWRMLCET